MPPADAPRNRRYGVRARPPQAWLAERVGWKRATLVARGRDLPLRYRVEGPFVREGAPHWPLFLLVVKGRTAEQRRRWRRRREPAFYLVNAVAQADGTWALPLTAPELLAWQRWEIAVAHRAMKSDAGVGAVQCYGARGPMAGLGLCRRRAGRLSGLGLRRPPRGAASAGPVAARWSVATLWRGYRHALDFHPAWTGPRGTWPAIETWLLQSEALLDTKHAA